VKPDAHIKTQQEMTPNVPALTQQEVTSDTLQKRKE
jgi:hypothetical protein